MGAAIMLERAQSHYLVEVLRLGDGEPVLLIDGLTGEWSARLTDSNRKQAVLTAVARLRPLETPPDLWLLFAPIKRGRIDWLAEKACELGVSRLCPVVTERTIVDRLPLDRMQAHLVESAEQCGRTALPMLDPPAKLGALLAAWPAGRVLLYCDEAGAPDLPSVLVNGEGGPPAALLIGPEGGFTPAERVMLRAHAACRPVSLGPRILRADTAAVAAIAAWQAMCGDWACVAQ